MKHLLKVTILLYLLILTSCKPSPQKAENYYDEILNPLEAVFNKEEEFIVLINKEMEESVNDSSIIISLMNNGDQDTVFVEIDDAFSNLKKQIVVSKTKLESLPDFDKNSDLKKSGLAVLDEYSRMCERDYPALLKIVKTPGDQYSHEDDDRFFELSEKIDSSMQEKISVLIKELKLFAKKYNFVIKNDTLPTDTLNNKL